MVTPHHFLTALDDSYVDDAVIIGHRNEWEDEKKFG